MANNKAVITFNRDGILNDSLEVLVQVFSLGSLLTFDWVVSPTSAFEVEIGTPTATTGERTAINFKTAWDNSVTGYTVTQSTNTVTIVGDENTNFVSIVFKDGSGNSYLIPTDYDVSFSTESAVGFPITYDSKVTLNTIPGDRVNQWQSADANEVKTKHNANNDRINQNVTDIATNASNIASNTSNISSNTSALAGKYDKTGGEISGDVTINSVNLFHNATAPTHTANSTNGTSGYRLNVTSVVSPTANLYRILADGVTVLTVRKNGQLELVNDLILSGVPTIGTSGQANTLVLLGDTGEDLTVTKNLDGTVTFENTNNETFVFEGLIRLKGYTVATLPTGSVGDTAYVTDALNPTYQASVSGGGLDYARVLKTPTGWIYS